MIKKTLNFFWLFVISFFGVFVPQEHEFKTISETSMLEYLVSCSMHAKKAKSFDFARC